MYTILTGMGSMLIIYTIARLLHRRFKRQVQRMPKGKHKPIQSSWTTDCGFCDTFWVLFVTFFVSLAVAFILPADTLKVTHTYQLTRLDGKYRHVMSAEESPTRVIVYSTRSTGALREHIVEGATCGSSVRYYTTDERPKLYKVVHTTEGVDTRWNLWAIDTDTDPHYDVYLPY